VRCVSAFAHFSSVSLLCDSTARPMTSTSLLIFENGLSPWRISTQAYV